MQLDKHDKTGLGNHQIIQSSQDQLRDRQSIGRGQKLRVRPPQKRPLQSQHSHPKDRHAPLRVEVGNR